MTDNTNRPLPLSGMKVVPAFIKTVLMFPVWLGVLLPVAITSQSISYIQNKLNKKSSSKDTEKEALLATKKETVEEILISTNCPESFDRVYDIVLLGATGFTGKLAAKYITQTYGLKKFRWAIAGRRRDALEKVKSELVQLNPEMKDLDIVIADVSDLKSLGNMIASTKVLITTAGPFSKYGSDVVRYCAAYGTHYCDITGESDWVREMVDKYDELAQTTGAHIVSFCGHDCIPWDLTTMRCADEIAAKGDTIQEIEIYDEIIAEASGGTLDTAFHIFRHRQVVKSSLGFDPFLKNKEGNKTTFLTVPKNITSLTYSKQHKAWTGPFFMAMVMANCVRRSNAVNEYSPKLVYREGVVYASFLAGVVALMQFIYFATVVASPFMSDIFLKYGLLPKPGEGPSVKQMDRGFLRVNAYAKGKNGTKTKALFTFPTDPGYRDTARMLVESGLVFIFNKDQVKSGGGVWTPATCQREALIERLVATGSTFKIETN